jgi:isoquinoline 1-oxidoreductase subunit alpha
MKKYSLNINNIKHTVEADPEMPLLWVIRDLIGMTGTKYGCGMSLCGACTVHLNGQPIRSCSTPIGTLMKNAKLTTIEGISTDNSHPVQKAWIEAQVPQCGYCQSGQIMAAVALLNSNPHPSDQDIDNALSGHLCRCGTYPRIKEAMKKLASV